MLLAARHAENPFAPLIAAWEQLEEVNMRIARNLQACCAKDGVRNGFANLDLFAKAGAFGLESALAALRPALLAWDLGQSLEEGGVTGASVSSKGSVRSDT